MEDDREYQDWLDNRPEARLGRELHALKSEVLAPFERLATWLSRRLR